MIFLARTLLALALLLSLVGCSKPDRTQPHEYIQIHTYSMTSAGLKQEDITSIASVIVEWERNYFEVNSGDCEKKLLTFTDKNLHTVLQAWNLAVSAGQLNQLPAAAFHLQCIASVGTDENCVRTTKEAARAITDPMQQVRYLFSALPACNIRWPVGQSRSIRLQ